MIINVKQKLKKEVNSNAQMNTVYRQSDSAIDLTAGDILVHVDLLGSVVDLSADKQNVVMRGRT